MFTVVMMSAALLAGYVVTVVLSLILTFAITLALPKFVVADFMIRTPYKLLHEGLWLACAGAGGYVAATVGKGAHTMITEGLLAALLIWLLWDNSWEARQRGMPHQILITTLTVVGVVAGYLIEQQVA